MFESSVLPKKENDMTRKLPVVSTQPISHDFKCTKYRSHDTTSLTTNEFGCLATVNELQIDREYTTNIDGVLNTFIIFDKHRKELFVTKDDLSHCGEGQKYSNFYDHNNTLVLQLIQTVGLYRASYEIRNLYGNHVASLKYVCDPCLPVKRMYKYGVRFATFRLMCCAGKCGETVWQILDDIECCEIGRLVFKVECCDTAKSFRLTFADEVNVADKALLLGASLFVILQYQSIEGTDD